VLGARRKSERETRKLRCAKPSATKPSRRRIKPILNWTKKLFVGDSEKWTKVMRTANIKPE
jgi:hypothetical protein